MKKTGNCRQQICLCVAFIVAWYALTLEDNGTIILRNVGTTDVATHLYISEDMNTVFTGAANCTYPEPD